MFRRDYKEVGFFQMVHPKPLFRLFTRSFSKRYHIYNQLIVHSESGGVIQTHDLLNTSLPHNHWTTAPAQRWVIYKEGS